MIIRSISARLAAIYTAAFALAVVALGVVILLAIRTTAREQFEAHIRTESASLMQEFHSEGMTDVVEAVRERDRTEGALDYGLIGPGGRPLAGWLAGVGAPLGWSTQTLLQPNGQREVVRLWVVTIPDGSRLLVGDDLSRIEALDLIVLRGFALTLVGVTVLGAAGGYFFSRGVRRRFVAMTEVAEAISEGDLSRRVPVRARADDLDQLALTFNRMLDRIGALLESLRQVSNDIAHDLRTPLTRLRQRLETAQAAPDAETRTAAIDAALGDLDGALETFAALLRIAQIEAGARRAGLRPVELTGIARVVVESFAPSAEEGGRSLTLIPGPAVTIDGDAELLTQMLVNLVENGLRHTPRGAHVRVAVTKGADGGALLSVSDDGPGVPAAEHARLFDRFYRLEQSRTTPGSGLGLSLASAVAKLHGAAIVLSDAAPGLVVTVAFPRKTA